MKERFPLPKGLHRLVHAFAGHGIVALNDADNDEDDRNDEQQMHEPSDRIHADDAKNPQDNENCCDDR